MGTLRAHVDLIDSPTQHYRKDAFCAGLERLGYKIEARPFEPKRDDCLVLWNRFQRDENMARQYERAGSWVVVAENGPFSKQKPPDRYSFYLWHHNGAGKWHVGEEPRWHPQCEGWRKEGKHVLLLPGRGMGEPGVRQERSWLGSTIALLRGQRCSSITIRPHPGVHPHPEIDWTDVWACVTWGSAAGLKAIVAGVPVFHSFPLWVGRDAATQFPAPIENPYRGDRSKMLHKLSWAMWTAEEIATGEPFRHNFQDAYRSGDARA